MSFNAFRLNVSGCNLDDMLTCRVVTTYSMLKSTNLLTSHPLSIKPLVQTSSGLINAFPTPNTVPVINALLQTTTTSAASARTASASTASDVLDLVETRISDKSQNIKLKNLRRSR